MKAERLGTEGQGRAILAWLEQRADVALAAMQMGVCDEALRRTALYTTERKQFGAPLGSFQAVAMRAADAYVDCEALRSAWAMSSTHSRGIDRLAAMGFMSAWICPGGMEMGVPCMICVWCDLSHSAAADIGLV